MSIRTLIAAATLAFTSLAQAEGPVLDWPQQAASTLSRAEVRQAAADARAAGLIVVGERTTLVEEFMSSKTRGQVRAELAEARRLGLVGHGDQPVIATPAQNEQVRLAGLRALQTEMASAAAGTVLR